MSRLFAGLLRGTFIPCALILVFTAGPAVAIAIGVLYLIDFSKRIIGIEPYVFTKYMGLPWQVINHMAQGVDYQWSTDVWRMAAMSLGYSVTMFVAGLVIFSRRDLNG